MGGEERESLERAVGRLTGELRGVHKAIDAMQNTVVALGDKVGGVERGLDRVRWYQFFLGGLCALAGGAVGGVARDFGIRALTVAGDLGDMLRDVFG